MWLSFLIVVAVSAAFVYAPGYFLMRALRANRMASVCLAPLPSLLIFNIAAFVCSKAGIFGDWLTIVVPSLVLCVAAYAVSRVLAKKDLCEKANATWGFAGNNRTSWMQLGTYAVVGVLVACFAFASSLEAPNSVLNAFDNVFHMGTIRAFVDSGMCSVFDSRMYVLENVGQASSPYFPTSGRPFYPTTWHLLVALVVSATGAGIPVAVNGCAFFLVALAFPVSMFCLMRHVFPDNDQAVWVGSIISGSFAAFPWDFLIFGPLYPNVMGYAFLPTAMVCFMCLFASRDRVQASLQMRILMFVGMGASLVLVHPNTVFTAVVLLAPYLCHVVSCAAAGSSLRLGARLKAVAGYALCAIALVAIWMAIYFTPFMQNGPLSDFWPVYAGKTRAVLDIVTVAYKEPSQWLLALLVAVGAIDAIRKRDHRWLVVSYVIAAVIFFVNISLDIPLRSFLAGFWYTDSHRTAATLALAGIPLATLGMAQVCRWIFALLKRLTRKEGSPRRLEIVTMSVVVVFSFFNFCPVDLLGSPDPASTAFGWIKRHVFIQNSFVADQVYSTDEQRFVQEVLEVVPEDALIINNPNDGSMFAFSVDDMNTYYRYLRGYGADDELPGSILIRHDLASLMDNPEVAQAVRDCGAHYVMQLDAGDYLKPMEERHPHLWTYDDVAPWRGIDQVNEDTPGFKLVLSEGDMRLYEIVGAY